MLRHFGSLVIARPFFFSANLRKLFDLVGKESLVPFAHILGRCVLVLRLDDLRCVNINDFFDLNLLVDHVVHLGQLFVYQCRAVALQVLTARCESPLAGVQARVAFFAFDKHATPVAVEGSLLPLVGMCRRLEGTSFVAGWGSGFFFRHGFQ